MSKSMLPLSTVCVLATSRLFLRCPLTLLQDFLPCLMSTYSAKWDPTSHPPYLPFPLPWVLLILPSTPHQSGAILCVTPSEPVFLARAPFRAWQSASQQRYSWNISVLEQYGSCQCRSRKFSLDE